MLELKWVCSQRHRYELEADENEALNTKEMDPLSKADGQDHVHLPALESLLV